MVVYFTFRRRWSVQFELVQRRRWQRWLIISLLGGRHEAASGSQWRHRGQQSAAAAQPRHVGGCPGLRQCRGGCGPTVVPAVSQPGQFQNKPRNPLPSTFYYWGTYKQAENNSRRCSARGSNRVKCYITTLKDSIIKIFIEITMPKNTPKDGYLWDN